MQTRSRRTRIVNRTDWPNHFLRRMLAWVKSQVGCRSMPLATFGNRSKSCWSGHCKWSRKILVRIGPENQFPTSSQYPGRPLSPVFQIADRTEALLYVTIHETIHARDMERGHKSVSEADTQFRTRRYLDAFRKDRDALMTEWNQPVKERPKSPAKSRSEKTLERNQKALSRWEAKMKLARTKVAKYRAAVRAGERYAAAKTAKGS